MATIKVKYTGELRTEAVHDRSQAKVITDAPTDNHGKGEAFSPTDLIAASLLTCMITVMGIQADKQGLSLGEVTGTIEKIMASHPRRIAILKIAIGFKNHHLSTTQRGHLERIALDCPVAQSIHPDIQQEVQFIYD